MRYISLLVLILFSWPFFAQETAPYQKRQQEILEKYPGSLTIVASVTDTDRKNLNFRYLTGEECENSILVLTPQPGAKAYFFSDEIKEVSYDAKIFPRGEYTRKVGEMLKNHKKINVINNYHVIFDHLETFHRVDQVTNIIDELVFMRVIKDSYEIKQLRKACQITADGLSKVFREAEVGMTEKDLIEIMVNYFKEQGSEGASFYQAASGPHSVNIHFDATERQLQSGDLVVFDIGAWYGDYTADISRTIPANGKFTNAQKEIYQVVLDAQKAAIEEMQPGARLLDVQQTAEDKLIEGLHRLGLVTDVSSEWQRKLFIQHGFYHFIGMYVHDVWYDFRETLEDKIYEPGMIMTMEPGVYFPATMLDEIPERIKEMVEQEEFKVFAKKTGTIYSKYANMGVRIEDDVLITKTGNEVLTKSVPKEIKEIERLMQNSK